MAKKSMIAREVKRAKATAKGRAKRNELKQIINDPNASYDDKIQAVEKRNKRKRNESRIRIQTRCRACGRPHAVYRKFGLCRIHLREAAMRGDVPGLSKSSW